MAVRSVKRFVLIGVLLLAGCSAVTSQEALYVEQSLNVEQVAVWEPFELTTYVEVEGKPVADATVEIEIQNEHGQSVGIVTPTSSDNGIYKLETVLDVAGQYEVISHVTVGEEHNMPSTELLVVE